MSFAGDILYSEATRLAGHMRLRCVHKIAEWINEMAKKILRTGRIPTYAGREEAARILKEIAG